MKVKLLTFGASVLLLACSHDPPPVTGGAASATAAHTSDETHAPGHSAAPKSGRSLNDEYSGAKPRHDPAPGKKHDAAGYAVPFVWETSKNDPLAIARGHLKEILSDNNSYLQAYPKANSTPSKTAPRSTILTCSDAAVQINSLDSTPENDAFVTRNWGNLLESSLGSVAYGIEQLRTPVLLIVGHTGCEAVKAAISDAPLGKRLRNQIKKLKVKSAAHGESEAQSVNASVRYNVNRQVAKAVQLFRPLVHTGTLTVIGAIYDPHNALARGAGRLEIVNVNSVTEPNAMRAFVAAVMSDDKIVAHGLNAEPPAAQGQASSKPHEITLPAGPSREDHSLHRTSNQAQRVPVAAGPEAPVPNGARGLPQIDHLEASLLGDNRPQRASQDH